MVDMADTFFLCPQCMHGKIVKFERKIRFRQKASMPNENHINFMVSMLFVLAIAISVQAEISARQWSSPIYTRVHRGYYALIYCFTVKVFACSKTINLCLA